MPRFPDLASPDYLRRWFRARRSVAGLPLLMTLLLATPSGQAADAPSSAPSPNYQAADRFAPASLRPFLYDTAVNPHWIGKTDAFWYAFRTSDGTNYVRINPRTASREPLFDRDKLANLLSAEVQKPLEPALLPITRLVVNDEGTKIRFVLDDFRYEYDLATEALTKLGKVQPNLLRNFLSTVGGGGGRGGNGDGQRQQEEQWDDRGQNQNRGQNGTGNGQGDGQRQDGDGQQQQQQDMNREQQVIEDGRRQDGDGQTRVDQRLGDGGQGQAQGSGGNRNPNDYRSLSPDGKIVVFARNHNLFIAEAGKEDAATALSTDGVEDYSFATGGFGRGGNGNGTTTDDLNRSNSNTPPPVDPNRKVRAAVNWAPDSKAFAVIRFDSRNVRDLFVINSLTTPRPTLEKYKYPMPGEAEVRKPELFVADVGKKALTRVPTKWKDETYTNLHWGKTAQDFRFIRRDRLVRHLDFCTLDATAGTGTAKVLIAEGFENANLQFTPARYLDDTNEMIWWSERTGWGHFYLYDRDGKLKNAITTGPYRASAIVEVDPKNRLLYFLANGHEAKENIYHQHLYRVNLDGTGLALLDPGAANHRSILSPTRQFLVDNASRVDLPPAAVVRAADGHEVMALERADLSRLAEAGWKAPETFTVKAADGVTDLYGNLWKPFDFDPKKSYPIIVHVYPGPQQEGTTHAFTAAATEQQLAQVGFIVIQVGHRGGTPTRSKAYHSFGYGNLRDYGLADKKAAIEQLAARHPFINVNKVGIYGHSGGGFMTAAAMMQKPYNDFFKVGVSTSGNHDNNIYNSSWSETYHGLKEVAVADEKKDDKDAPPTRSGRGRGQGQGQGTRSTQAGDPIEADGSDGLDATNAMTGLELDDLAAAIPILEADDAEATATPDDKKADEAKAEDKKVETKKADEAKTDGDKKVEPPKVEDKKVEDKKVETKADEKKSETKADEKKSDDKKTEAKNDEKKAEAKNDEKKAEAPKTKFEIRVPTNTELAENLKGRLLLVHGELDNNVHPANTLRLVDALIRANKRFDMLYLPGKRHAYADYQDYVNKRMMEYFAEHLLGDYQPTADLGDKSPFGKKGE